MRVRDVMTEGAKTAESDRVIGIVTVSDFLELTGRGLESRGRHKQAMGAEAPGTPPQIKRSCGCLVIANRTHWRVCTGVSDVPVCGTLR